MRRVTSVVLVCVLALTSWGSKEVHGDEEWTYDDYEQGGSPCGTVSRSNASIQLGNSPWLKYIVSTLGAIDICGQWWTQTGATVAGIAGSTSNSGTKLLYSEVVRSYPANYNTTYVTTGGHLWSVPVPFVVYVTATSTSSVTIAEPPPQSPEELCMINGGYWNGFECNLPNSPIIVDAARNGYNLTSVENGVRFDLDADGIREQVAWTRRNSDEAFLAMDRNGNGFIDDGSELFGNRTPVTFAGAVQTAGNGFDALRFEDSLVPGLGLPDNIIDRRDAIFPKLLLWTDRNHNGLSEPDELETVRAASLKSIDTKDRPSRRVDRHGNEFRQKSTVEWRDGDVSPVFDVWLRWRD